jgi:hypothetical protein
MKRRNGMIGRPRLQRQLILALFCLGAFLTFARQAAAAELIMFESSACEWCEAWQRDVGIVYPLTPEGRYAPLRRVNIFDDRPADLSNIKGVVYTPTFVLFSDGLEIGRIHGYPGEDHFWGLLNVLLKELPPQPQS